MGIHGTYVSSAETCVDPFGSAGTSGEIRLGYCGISGSLISMNHGGESCPSLSNTRISKFPSGSISGIFISTSYSSESTPGNSTSPSSELESTPGVYMFPMRRPCLSAKVISLGWFLPNVLKQEITVSDMGIKYQFRHNFLA